MLTKENGFTLPWRFSFPHAGKYAFTFLALLVVLLAIYSNSFRGEWHFDDYANIVENPNIRMSSFSCTELKQCAAGIYHHKLYRPLSYLSFGLNYRLDGLNVLGFHVLNFIIHYLSAAFLFLLLFNTMKLPLLKDEYGQVAYPAALLATLFWAVHPVWVTSVSYIVQRMTSMAAMFYILSMYFYLKARTAEKSSSSITLFIGCALAGIASVLTKENAVMLPLSILLFDLILIQGATPAHVKKSVKVLILPLLLLVAVGLLYTGGFANAFKGYAVRDFTLTERLLTEPRILFFYLSLLLYPIGSRLTLLYDVNVSRSLIEPWTTLPSLLGILLIIGFAFYLARRRPLISFAILFFFLNHLVESSVLPLELVYEHRNYLPAAFLFVLVAQFIVFVIDYFSYKRAIQILVSLSIVILLLGMGDVTYRRNHIFADDFLLWMDNIEKSPGISRPYTNLGRIYANLGEKDRAFALYQKAMALDRFENKTIRAVQETNLGMYYFDQMQNDLAMDYFVRSARVIPDYKNNILYIARINLRQNNIAEAARVILDKLNKYPNHQELLELHAFILLKEEKFTEARAIARKCLSRNQNSFTALGILAEASRRQKKYSESIVYWKMLRAFEPQYNLINLALMEIYHATHNKDALQQEIRLFLYMRGSVPLESYIQSLTTDEKLLVYVPDVKSFLFLKRNCTELN